MKGAKTFKSNKNVSKYATNPPTTKIFKNVYYIKENWNLKYYYSGNFATKALSGMGFSVSKPFLGRPTMPTPSSQREKKPDIFH